MFYTRKRQAIPAPAVALVPTRTVDCDSSRPCVVLSGFDTIRLSEMDDVSLLRRTDIKYVLSEAQLFQALAHLTDDYRILEIDGRRQHRYETLYFDTPDLALYLQHHNGWRNRYKVRERAYSDSGLAFLEVKHKVNDSTTFKSRVQTQGPGSRIASDTRAFLHTCYPYHVEALDAKLLNTFQRITLVGKHCVERLTVDLGLCFSWNDMHVSLAGIAVAEVKQSGFSMDSAFVQHMRLFGVRPAGFSKYCIGVSILYPEIKHNSFEPTLRRINQFMRGGNHV